MGVFGLQTLVGRHRDSNPGPPACESGVVAITLRGPPLPMWHMIEYYHSVFDFSRYQTVLKPRKQALEQAKVEELLAEGKAAS